MWALRIFLPALLIAEEVPQAAYWHYAAALQAQGQHTDMDQPFLAEQLRLAAEQDEGLKAEVLAIHKQAEAQKQAVKDAAAGAAAEEASKPAAEAAKAKAAAEAAKSDAPAAEAKAAAKASPPAADGEDLPLGLPAVLGVGYLLNLLRMRLFAKKKQ